MRTTSRIAGAWLTAALALSTLAGPLPRNQVSRDAKWLIHLDVQNLAKTQLGQALGQELDAKLVKPRADLKQSLGIDFNWHNIHSLTAYGTTFAPNEQAVLLITTTMDVKATLDTAMAKLTAKGPLRRLESDPSPLYCLNHQIYIAVPPGQPVILGKSEAEVKQARAVLLGHAPNLAGSHTFTGYPAVPRSFFFLGVAEGFNQSAALPPQARVLKMADGLRLVAGESGDQVRVFLNLKAKTAQICQQIQQVAQGMVALFLLGQKENPALRELAQNTHVTASDRLVNLELDLPVAQILKHIHLNVKPSHRTTGTRSSAPTPSTSHPASPSHP